MAIIMSGGPPRREGFLSPRRRCFLCTAEKGHAGIAGGKIGEGAFSEAYAWAPGQVAKLFKADVSHLLGRRGTHDPLLRAAGVRVPELFGEMTLDGRFGIVMRRLDGPTFGISREPAR